ncbi:10810_t:CDS:2 [Dentiscutata heterogama]|uniref:10810_t:CDS:1 n=1 Tax=Dentiscutata heterogama TaxID=1316150 RepID=A0ACA9JVU5_9GLOM|nr:10810_t:CDS:2 [Dentiscutata heterogama]
MADVYSPDILIFLKIFINLEKLLGYLSIPLKNFSFRPLICYYDDSFLAADLTVKQENQHSKFGIQDVNKIL